MGLARTDDLFLPIHDPAQVAERRRLLRDQRDDVFAVADGQPAAVHDLLARAEDGQDDVCALRPGPDDVFRLVGASLCFPSHWVLAEKLGRSLGEIHDPVPGYAETLSSKVDVFVSRLRPGQVVARCNRLLHESDALFAPRRLPTDGSGPATWVLRSERQALGRLDDSDVVAFTIRTRQVRLDRLPADVAHRLADQLVAEPLELSAYRGYADQRPALIDFLRARGHGAVVESLR